MAGALKKIYHIVAAFALLNCLAAGGVSGWLFSSGRLNAERGRQILAMLGDEAPIRAGLDAAVDQESSADVSVPSGIIQSDELIEDEMRWRNTDRYRAQIEQRLKFMNAVKLDVDRRREELERLREQERLALEQLANDAKRPGYQKELDILSALSPKAALRQIMTMSDADAARVVFELHDRKVKQIFESAKAPAELEKLTTVRELLRDLQPPPTVSNPADGASS